MIVMGRDIIKKNMKQNMKNDLMKKLKLFWKGWGYSIFVAVIIASSFKSAIADWNIVPTGSMKPTIVEGDRIFINKLAYDLKIPYTTWHIAEWRAPQRGDIVVFYSPADGRRLVKRVVGIPGDLVEMQNDQLIINGKHITYESCESVDNIGDNGPSRGRTGDNYRFTENLNGVKHPIMIIPMRPALRSFGPVVVPKGKFFMMGDNRDNSADSRYFGFVERNRIVGQALSIVASFDINHNYHPRWERFFTKLP